MLYTPLLKEYNGYGIYIYDEWIVIGGCVDDIIEELKNSLVRHRMNS